MKELKELGKLFQKLAQVAVAACDVGSAGSRSAHRGQQTKSPSEEGLFCIVFFDLFEQRHSHPFSGSKEKGSYAPAYA